MFAEVFIPSGGAILVMSLSCLGGALWCGFNAWWDTNPRLWWAFLVSTFIMIPFCLSLALWIFPKTPFGKRILLNAPNLNEVTAYQSETEQLAELVGETGKTSTPTNPSGFVQLNGVRYHCETPGLMLDTNIEVEVIGVKGNRLVVQPVNTPLNDALEVSENINSSEPVSLNEEPDLNPEPEQNSFEASSAQSEESTQQETEALREPRVATDVTLDTGIPLLPEEEAPDEPYIDFEIPEV